MKSKYDKTKMIYCHNHDCEYCDDVTGWCILTTDIEWKTNCPDNIKKLIHKYGNDLEKVITK